MNRLTVIAVTALAWNQWRLWRLTRKTEATDLKGQMRTWDELSRIKARLPVLRTTLSHPLDEWRNH